MDDGKDYDVRTKVNFWLNFDGEGVCNLMMLPEVQKQFALHVKEVFEQDDTLGCGYISSDLNFRFDGRNGDLEYTFSCHDENEAEAESFSTYCVRGVQKKLEEFGCKVRRISCKAEEADMTWLDELEDAIFGPREQPKEAKPPTPKKRRPGQER